MKLVMNRKMPGTTGQNLLLYPAFCCPKERFSLVDQITFQRQKLQGRELVGEADNI